MRIRKSFKIVLVSLTLLLAIVLVSTAIFVFNPFEGSLPDMRYAVPRDVDFFARKVDLADDFRDFPEPWFWEELRLHPEWNSIVQGPTYKSLNADGSITRMFEQIRDETDRIREQSSGYLDLMEDVIGTEVQIAGKLAVAGAPAKWCVYARVNWKVKALFGLLGYTFVQEEFRKSGTQVQPDEEFYSLVSAGQPTLHLARHLDAMFLGNDRDLVQRSWELAAGIGDPDSFGGSGSYNDGIKKRIRDWEEKTQVAANAVEFFIRPNLFFRLPDVTFDDEWPDPNHPTDMNSRVLASFLSLQGWLGLSGALIFEEGSMSLLASIELNQNEHTPFQAKFFQTESQSRRDWLDPFLTMVPSDACAAAALRMPAGEFLREMYGAMEEAEKSLINDSLRKTGQYDSMLDLIEEVEVAFLPRTGFVFRRNEFYRKPVPEIPIANPSPSPEVAWVFWLRKGGERICADFVEKLTKYRSVVGLDQAYNLPLDVGGGQVSADAAREFTQAQLPATGSFATLNYPPFFVISNSGPFIREMMRTFFDVRPSIRDLDDFQEYSRELPNAVNGFVYVNGTQISEVMRDYERDVIRLSEGVDPLWAAQNRSTAETNVFKREFAQQYVSIAGIPQGEQARFEELVRKELDDLWRTASSSYTADSRGAITETKALCRLLNSAYLQLTLEPSRLELTARSIAEFK